MDIFTQMLLRGSAGGSKSTYVEDVFSTYTFIGNATARSINNGIDNTKGGLVWIKDRTDGYNHVLQDTVRGAGATTKLSSNLGNGANDGDNALQWSGYVSAFNNNGFSLDKTGSGAIDWANVNKNGDDYVSWNFRESKGFFDVVTYTGNGSNRNIPHGLGCQPGMIIIKDLDDTDNWEVYHKSLVEINGSSHYYLILNGTQSQQYGASRWNNTEPNSSTFRLGQSTTVNQTGSNYVAYVFAGGKNTSATANGVGFNGSNSYLTQPADAALRNWWDQNFTVEYWIKADTFVSSGNGGAGTVGVNAPTSNSETWSFGPDSSGEVMFYYWNGSIQKVIANQNPLRKGQWYHLAMVYDGSMIKIYINGKLWRQQAPAGTPQGGSATFSIGKVANGSVFNGKICNLRITHQAVYTEDFLVPTEPLTTTSQGAVANNVKLLCCQSATTTDTTVSPGTFTANGGLFTSAGNPFFDPQSFKFGEEGDQNIVQCGSYRGGGAVMPEVYVGFQPQWILLKNINLSTEQWYIFDMIRGIRTNYSDYVIEPSRNVQENAWDLIDLTDAGFRIKINDDKVNNTNGEYVYMAIRRPDNLVGKLPEAGTDCFAMDVGNSSATGPAFDSGFPVDMVLHQQPAGSGLDWRLTTRYDQLRKSVIPGPAAESDENNNYLDYNDGFAKDYTNVWQSWMWKRNAGFDVQFFQGTAHDPSCGYRHGLGQVPELKMLKRTDQAYDWYGTGTIVSQAMAGTNEAKDYYLSWQNNAAAVNTFYWTGGNDTKDFFTVRGGNAGAGGSNDPFICVLFASVEGVSKCGHYVGNTSDNPINLGFTPRFLMIKRVDATGDWCVFDTLRGIASAVSGNAEQLYTHEQNTQQTYSWTAPAGVTSVSVVAVGAGGGGIGPGGGQNYGIGGGGGGLGYKNNISVTPGQSYTVKVGGKGNRGAHGSGQTDPTSPSPNKGDSYFIDASTVRGGGGEGGYSSSNGGRGGDYTGDGGGNGGRGGPSVNSGGNKGGGGGAGGYAGNGGDGMNAGGNGGTGTAGQGGAGGGSFGGGGGVGLNGQGTSANFSWNNGAGGSGGGDGTGYAQGGTGGNYGGGGGCVDNAAGNGSEGGQGAVRIIWNTSGNARSFPSTNVGPPVDKVLKLNSTAAQFDQDCLSTSASGITLTGADSLINVNGGKYIYYAHA